MYINISSNGRIDFQLSTTLSAIECPLQVRARRLWITHTQSSLQVQSRIPCLMVPCLDTTIELACLFPPVNSEIMMLAWGLIFVSSATAPQHLKIRDFTAPLKRAQGILLSRGGEQKAEDEVRPAWDTTATRMENGTLMVRNLTYTSLIATELTPSAN